MASEPVNIKGLIDFGDFLKVDIRVGTIISARPNPKAHKAAYILELDFGELGTKTSSAQITENYTEAELLNKQIAAVVNFRPKKVAGIKSEVLVLAVVCEEHGTVLLELNSKVSNGMSVL